MEAKLLDEVDVGESPDEVPSMLCGNFRPPSFSLLGVAERRLDEGNEKEDEVQGDPGDSSMRGESRTALEREELSVFEGSIGGEFEDVEATRHISSFDSGSSLTINVFSSSSSSSLSESTKIGVSSCV